MTGARFDLGSAILGFIVGVALVGGLAVLVARHNSTGESQQLAECRELMRQATTIIDRCASRTGTPP